MQKKKPNQTSFYSTVPIGFYLFLWLSVTIPRVRESLAPKFVMVDLTKIERVGKGGEGGRKREEAS